MFRRVATSFFRLSQQCGVQFRLVCTLERRRLLASVAGIQLGAATAVAISDKQLLKKPEWYQHAVLRLEKVLKKTSKYGYIESQEFLDEAYDVLLRVSDLENTEILWRLARVLVEKAELSKSEHEKEAFLKEAAEFSTKALAYEGATPSAGAHKWHAITLAKLAHYQKEDRQAEIREHLEKATQIDAADPHAWHLLGLSYFKTKHYKEAIDCFQKAEEVKPNFSPTNLCYLGAAQKATRDKKAAIESYKKAMALPVKTKTDGRAKLDAKKALSLLKVKPEEYAPVEDIY
uniref:Regulator of microtubule dynamics protein 1 n=1 Tax=Ascaris suum TaxID=6253 RepID=F1L961_ASCSU